ncbi:glycosyltransferase family 4 protein [Halorussus gelatinilyticus]|uniref:Glycosyltransferase family 4 protein n=1 Tax=Halorussus gelatinilyticus TaxID=2937524 RepID=A0A8U0IMP6_9EURY|nr:glycosyltransferase family 4 protein [Halorussus gelatinilyticus]UPW01289.1 glycosyltransferase family 4 protein [Halorussus gelatinilyticus]
MRILRVAQKVYPDVKGGGPYHVHAMSRDQADRGHDVTVLTVSDDDSKPRREERDGYTVVRRKPTAELLGNDISSGVAKFLASAGDYDVIHAHSHLYFSTNLAALKRRLGDIPLAITNHGLYSQNAPEWVFDAYLKTAGRWTFDSADVVLCYTEEDRERVQGFGVNTDIEVVSNGIDQTRFTPEGPRSDLVDSDGPVVLFVGRLVDGKRPQDAVRAFAGVHREHTDTELYLCGDGPLHDKLQTQAAELGVSEAVTFLGHVSYDEMPKVYRSADILVLPSRAEGLPRTVLEAFAAETPAVTSDLEHVAPVVRHAGKTYPTGNTDAFEDALSELLSNPKRAKSLGEDGRKLVNCRFRWEETVTKTTAALGRISKVKN